jgi:peptidoglycan/xylan/chitin deacetylase (PgdA/CDA1 family)
VNRHQLAAFLDRARIPSALLALRSRGGSPWINAITYHRIGTRTGELDRDVIDATPEAFERHVTYMKRWFDIVGVDDLVAFTRGGALPKNPLIITFDDGYRDNHDVALPILAKHGVRATFFVATDFITERRLFWWDKIALIVTRSTRTHLDLEYPSHVSLPFETDGERAHAHHELLRIVKGTYGLDVDRFVDVVSAALGVPLSRDEEHAIADRALMTWDDTRDLARAGMDVQSHTRSHRVLQTLSDEELDAELRGSREIIEREVGAPVRALAYPVGRHSQVSPRIRDAVKRAGYELAFENSSGADFRWSFDPLNAKRLGLEIDIPDSFFRSILALPPLAY